MVNLRNEIDAWPMLATLIILLGGLLALVAK
jgi:hypothetical protein